MWKMHSTESIARPNGFYRYRQKQKNPCLESRVLLLQRRLGLLGNGDVRCREALRALLDFELHLVAFIQGLISACGDRIEVDEYIFTACTRYEAETFCCIEPFDCSFFHGTRPFVYCVLPDLPSGKVYADYTY